MSDQDLQKQITELLQRIEAMEARFEEADPTQAEAPIKPPPPPVSLPSKLKTAKQEKPKSTVTMTEGVGLEAPKPTTPTGNRCHGSHSFLTVVRMYRRPFLIQFPVPQTPPGAKVPAPSAGHAQEREEV